ncbi:hypothetical protein [Parachryseolinea silvisoli]|uniref:hypothetical protein n=1 Tax=Parachryseolinea silvisoli TaxID=2873601 RepID=UPI002265ECA6|nr:hypothetical protein [Parachryseolinea silvisoli]MCD9016898.1 hypothetical protein [Parachryseolinea silvisoli]
MTEARFLFVQYGVVLLLTAGVLCLLGSIGQRIVGWRIGNPYASWLARGFVGYLLVLIVYAVVCTGGVTVNLVFVPILALAFWEVRKNRATIAPVVRPARSVVGSALAALVLLFAWSWWTLYTDLHDIMADYGYADYVLYSRISHMIGVAGYENGFNFLNTYDATYHGAEPYHYFDLWGGSVVATIFSLNHYLTLKLVVYPLFFWFIFLGYGAQVHRPDTPWRSFFVLILLLFISGVYFHFYRYHPFLQSLASLQFNVLTPTINKLSYFYVFLLSALLLYRHGQTNLALLCLCSLPVANIVSFPVWCAAGGVVVVAYLRKAVPANMFWQQVLCIAVPVCGVFIFYAIFKQNELGLGGAEIAAPAKLLVQAADGFQWRTRFNIVVGSVLHLFILYAPIVLPLLIFFVVNKIWPTKRYFLPAGVVALCILGGIGAWALLYQELNSFQVFSNISIVLLNILVAVGVIYVYNRLPSRSVKYSIVCLTLMMALLLVQGAQAFSRLHAPDVHSSEYLGAVQRAVAQYRLRAGVSIKDARALQDIFSKYNAAYPMGDYLVVMRDGLSVVNIGDFNTPIDSSSVLNQYRSVKAIQNGLFYKQVMQAHKNEVPSGDVIEREQVAFIRRHRMQFVILSANAALPEALAAEVVHEITDSKSGERFLILK